MTGDSLFGSTTLTGLGSIGTQSVRYVIVNGKYDKEKGKNLLTTTVVTGATTTTLSAYSTGRQMAHRTASAYIDSLNDQELAALELMLENKENEMANLSDLIDINQNIKSL